MHITTHFTQVISCVGVVKVLPVHNLLGMLQAWRAQAKRYNIVGAYSYVYEVNEAVANSALYCNACSRLNQLFEDHGSLKKYRFTEQRTRV